MAEAHAAEPDAIERRGNWITISRDATLKRVSCRCATCGHLCLIGAEALEGGVNCPGCLSPHSVLSNVPPAAHLPSAKPDRSDSFAGAVADMEGRNAWKRHKGGGVGS
jgi:hypothetical protein